MEGSDVLGMMSRGYNIRLAFRLPGYRRVVVEDDRSRSGTASMGAGSKVRIRVALKASVVLSRVCNALVYGAFKVVKYSDGSFPVEVGGGFGVSAE